MGHFMNGHGQNNGDDRNQNALQIHPHQGADHTLNLK